MKHLTPEEVVAIVGSGQFDDLIGTVEDAHLEAKSGIYPDTDRGRMELAKDVCSAIVPCWRA